MRRFHVPRQLQFSMRQHAALQVKHPTPRQFGLIFGAMSRSAMDVQYLQNDSDQRNHFPKQCAPVAPVKARTYLRSRMPGWKLIARISVFHDRQRIVRR